MSDEGGWLVLDVPEHLGHGIALDDVLDAISRLVERDMDGVGVAEQVVEVAQDQAPPRMVFDPGHPDANDEGYVAMPNINLVEEMVNMITASRSYESGVTVMNTLKGMAQSALSIGG